MHIELFDLGNHANPKEDTRQRYAMCEMARYCRETEFVRLGDNDNIARG